MPEFMDVHRGMEGITPEGLAEAHRADLAIQDDEAVDFKHAWADPDPRASRPPGRRGLSGPGPGVELTASGPRPAAGLPLHGPT